jgi:hypothetical protein
MELAAQGMIVPPSKNDDWARAGQLAPY